MAAGWIAATSYNYLRLGDDGFFRLVMVLLVAYQVHVLHLRQHRDKVRNMLERQQSHDEDMNLPGVSIP